MIRHTLLEDPYRLAPDIAPVVRELPADLETPVSVYLKLAGQGPSFLLESVTGGEQLLVHRGEPQPGLPAARRASAGAGIGTGWPHDSQRGTGIRP